ncbi:AAC(3) family N-acetyltransferase [Halohasta salina]|uniref:AAC(3) family N-acetyltransferase n=1 Tax=Halohasta salina TaxID=2961621 RepID=UPI0020A4D21F|nr:AAC(3) family N-acetyltransferase [Halohasta salina]
MIRNSSHSSRSTARRAIQRVTHLPETAWCSATHYLYKQRSRSVGPIDGSLLDTIIEGYTDDIVFVHIGLSDVKTALGGDPYEAIVDRLDRAFESVLVPGFTKSFRETRRFDVDDTPPELGAFSGLFFEDADYRTPDPLHSILVGGPYRFADCTFRDTFSPAGCYGRLSDDNVLCLNIGTPWLISTQLHYIERICDVPYASTIEIEGELRADGSTESITQRTYSKNNYLYFWNRRGLRDDMVAAGVMDHYLLDGLNVMGVRAGDMEAFLAERIESDPYYLVR